MVITTSAEGKERARMRAGQRGRSARSRRDLRNGLLFVSPWIVGFLAFQLYPMLASLYYSFTNYSIVGGGRWVGLDNYRTMLKEDPQFWLAVGNTLYYAAISVPLGLLVSFTLALLLNLQLPEMPLYRALYFLPTLVPAVAASTLFLYLLNPEYGLVNGLLQLIGLSGPGWLTDPAWAKPSLILLSFWGIGLSTIIFLAGLGNIPQELHEAAMLDGANWLQRLRAVVIPLMTPTIFFNLIMGIIGSFQVFTQVYILGSGGSADPGNPPGSPQGSLLFYQLYLFVTAFTNLQMGYASAMAWALMLVILAITLIIFRTQGRWVFYIGAAPGEEEG